MIVVPNKIHPEEVYGSGYKAVQSVERQPTFRRTMSIFRVEELAEQETIVKQEVANSAHKTVHTYHGHLVRKILKYTAGCQ
jgi:hypothetical protein